MHYLHSFTAFLLPAIALASPLSVTVQVTDEGQKPIHAVWEKENKQLIVPLSSKARTGLIDIPTEEGLIYACETVFVVVMFGIRLIQFL